MRISDLAAGFCHVVALTSAGQVYAWGDNEFRQLGNLTSRDCYGFPVLVAGNLEGKFVTSIVCGFNHTIVLTDQGEVYGWGYNKHGRIVGDATKEQSMYIYDKVIVSPIKIHFPCEENTKIVSVGAGRHFSVALTDKGQVRN